MARGKKNIVKRKSGVNAAMLAYQRKSSIISESSAIENGSISGNIEINVAAAASASK